MQVRIKEGDRQEVLVEMSQTTYSLKQVQLGCQGVLEPKPWASETHVSQDRACLGTQCLCSTQLFTGTILLKAWPQPKLRVAMLGPLANYTVAAAGEVQSHATEQVSESPRSCLSAFSTNSNSSPSIPTQGVISSPGSLLPRGEALPRQPEAGGGVSHPSHVLRG